MRLIVGPDHRWLLLASALAGSILLLIADCIARVIVLPAELPTGILTALIGAPFFVALMLPTQDIVMAIQAQNISVHLAGFNLLRDIDLSIEPGQVTASCGPMALVNRAC